MPKCRVKISREIKVNTYVEMRHASSILLRNAKECPKGSNYQIMASLVFTAFTLEAYLNHIGKHEFNCWDDLEGLSPLKKLNVVTEKLGIKTDNSKRPFQTVIKLFKFRNDIAHGKTVSLKDETNKLLKYDDIDKELGVQLEPEWKKFCKVNNADQAREDVDKIIKQLHEKSGVTDDPLFAFGMSVHSADLLEEV